MSFESLTPEDILVNLRNTQSETFSKLCELMATNFEKLRSMENLLNEIKGKVEKLENAVPAEVEDNEEPKSQGTLEKEFAESLMVKLENMEKEKVGASTSIPWPVQVEEGDEHDEKPDKKPGKLTDIHCYDCKKTFVRGSGKFTRHIKETPCKPYQCHCLKLFKKKSSLTAHQSTHSTAIFPCHCGSIFRCQQYLNNHTRRKTCTPAATHRRTIAKTRRSSSLSSSDMAIDKENVSSMEEPIVDPAHFLNLQFLEG